MKISPSVVPSLFTTLNMFCGFISITYSLENKFDYAIYFILFGAIFDSLDGIMARLTKSSSKFGVEFDSLSDLVTFGVAVSVLVYQYEFKNWNGFGQFISSFPMICGGIRLARFNVQLTGFDKEYFIGLPIPSQAAIMCSFLLMILHNNLTQSILSIDTKYILAVLTVSVSLIMVSTIIYEAFPKFTKKDIQKHPLKFFLVLSSLLLIIFSQGNFIFPVFLIYLLFGILKWIFEFVKRMKNVYSDENYDDDFEIEIFKK